MKSTIRKSPMFISCFGWELLIEDWGIVLSEGLLPIIIKESPDEYRLEWKTTTITACRISARKGFSVQL